MSQVTLIPRGQARGLTWFLPGEDPSLISKQQIFARIVGALGGRAAEEVVFGDAEVTTGASSDLQMASGGGGGGRGGVGGWRVFEGWRGSCQGWGRPDVHLLCPRSHLLPPSASSLQVTNMARQMVVNYGFSDIGPWSLLDPSAQGGDMIMRMMARNSVSEALQVRIDAAVKKIAADAYAVALQQIRDNREAIDAAVEVLMDKETISGDEFRTIVSRYTEIPAVNLEAARDRSKDPILA